MLPCCARLHSIQTTQSFPNLPGCIWAHIGMPFLLISACHILISTPKLCSDILFLAISPKHHALKEFVSMSVSPVGLGLLKALSQSLACSRYSKHVYWADLIMIIYRVSIIISWFLVPAEFLADSFCKGKKGGFTLRLSTALV